LAALFAPFSFVAVIVALLLSDLDSKFHERF
jgi:hypothetical protein